MQDGSRQAKQGINLATNSFTYDECTFLCNILKDKYTLKCTVVKAGFTHQNKYLKRKHDWISCNS